LLQTKLIKKVLVLNHRTAPDLPVAYAVRMSMSIPFLWEDIIWREIWGKYRNKDIAGHSIVDGGVLSNCPIEYVLEDINNPNRMNIKKVMGPTEKYPLIYPINPDRVICFVFDMKKSLGWKTHDDKPAKPGLLQDLQKSTPLIPKVESFMSTLLDAHDKQVISNYKKHVVRIPAKEVDTTEFSMSEEKMKFFMKRAEEVTEKFLLGKGLKPLNNS